MALHATTIITVGTSLLPHITDLVTCQQVFLFLTCSFEANWTHLPTVATITIAMAFALQQGRQLFSAANVAV